MISTTNTLVLVSITGVLASLLGCSVYITKNKITHIFFKYATPFAAGSLLATVFLDLYKEGLETSEPQQMFIGSLVGVLLFFFAERFLSWFHHNHGQKDEKNAKNVSLILTGNAAHNALDGVSIAASFLISVPTGIITTLAVTLHEIPHNVFDFGLLLKRGMPRKKTFWLTFLANLSTMVVATIVFKMSSSVVLPISFLLGLSAGFLLYIALSDIMPEVHENASKKRLLDMQTAMLLLGVLAIAVLMSVVGYYFPE